VLSAPFSSDGQLNAVTLRNNYNGSPSSAAASRIDIQQTRKQRFQTGYKYELVS
jgi:hypothetical protein